MDIAQVERLDPYHPEMAATGSDASIVALTRQPSGSLGSPVGSPGA
jgi:hypothetical protein